MPCLIELNFVGNPLEEQMTAAGTWRDEVSKKLAKLKKLDGMKILSFMAASHTVKFITYLFIVIFRCTSDQRGGRRGRLKLFG